MAKKMKSSKVFEIIWYTLCGAVALWGLTYITLGIIANELPVHSSKNVLLQASNTIKDLFGLDFFGWGLIILGIAAVAIVIVLLVFAKQVDRDFEKTQRRAARRNALQNDEEVVAEVE